jgi:LCP family protein required for cell wall assembly
VKLIPRTRGGALLRFALAGVLMITCVAAATAVAGLLQVQNIVNALNGDKAIKVSEIQDLPALGAPETILAIGTDRRLGTKIFGNTDTMMLIRLDANSSTINVISIPRDLEVHLPGYGGQRINAAYTIGGPDLLLRTLRAQVFPGLVVNHIVILTFGGFEKLIDGIGCVYGDVDHRYYNNTALTDYSSIDIQPGYQKMCNSDALAFVRFRHTDSDIVRNARQQDFIRWAKGGYGVGELLANRDRLLSIFGHNSYTDPGLHSVDGLISLFDLVLNLEGHTIKSIRFPYVFGNCTSGGQTPCYVYAQSAGAAHRAYHAFMTPTAAPATAPSTAASTHRHKHGHPPPVGGLTADSADGRSQSAQVGAIGIPVFYPKLILANSYYCFAITGNCSDPTEPAYEYAHSYPRAYTVRAPDHAGYPAYRMTIAINPVEGWYYGVQGMAWRDPPILNHPTQTQVINGKSLMEFFDGHKLSLVAWRTPVAVYWVTNTLDDHIPNGQLKAIAASLTHYTG